ncbi:MAG: hypothetical protein ABUM26_04535, partial [Solirubrobacterales bacterium]
MLAAVALGMGSIGVASASATAPMWMEFPLSSSTPATVSGTLQLSEPMAPGVTVSCPVLTTAVSFPGSAPPIALNGGSGGTSRFLGMSRQTCSNGKQFDISLTLYVGSAPGSPTVIVQSVSPNTSLSSPITVASSTTWSQTSTTVPLTNGAGGVPTKLLFNNTVLGWQYNQFLN